MLTRQLIQSRPTAELTETKPLGVKPKELVHIGDREQNDIEGPHRIGACAVLCTAVVDRRNEGTKADAVFSDYRDLPDIIAALG